MEKFLSSLIETATLSGLHENRIPLSGGEIFPMQSLLGYRSLDTVRHNARLPQVDVEQAYQRSHSRG